MGIGNKEIYPQTTHEEPKTCIKCGGKAIFMVNLEGFCFSHRSSAVRARRLAAQGANMEHDERRERLFQFKERWGHSMPGPEHDRKYKQGITRDKVVNIYDPKDHKTNNGG